MEVGEIFRAFIIRRDPPPFPCLDIGSLCHKLSTALVVFISEISFHEIIVRSENSKVKKETLVSTKKRDG